MAAISQLLARQPAGALHELLGSKEFCSFLDGRVPAALTDIIDQPVDISSLRAAQYAVLADFLHTVSNQEPWAGLLYQYGVQVSVKDFLTGMGMEEVAYLKWSGFNEEQIAGIKHGLLTIGDLVRAIPLPLLTPLLKQIQSN